MSDNFVVISLGSGFYDLVDLTDSAYTVEQINNEIHEYNFSAFNPKWVVGKFLTREAAETAISTLQSL